MIYQFSSLVFLVDGKNDFNEMVFFDVDNKASPDDFRVWVQEIHDLDLAKDQIHVVNEFLCIDIAISKYQRGFPIFYKN